MLVADHLCLTYGQTEALVDASVSVARSEIVAVTGSSGSGKTSLLYCLAALARPTRGAVRLGDQELTALSDEQRTAVRRLRFGFVFQFAELVPELTLRENVALPLELLRVDRRERRSRVEELLERLGLAPHAGRRPAQVSGGQAQRAAVARAVVHRPDVVFADEPTGSLDTVNGRLVLDAFVSVCRDYGAAVVLVTHDPAVAAFADRTVAMRDGRSLLDRPC